MKTFTSMVLVLISAVAFAGPEDHIQAQKCYNLVVAKGEVVSAHVPTQICLESVTLDTGTGQVDIYSYFQPLLYKNLKTDSLIRHTEDRYKYKVSSVVYQDEGAVCSASENVSLEIAGETDFTGYGDIDYLDIQVRHETLRDSCHSYPEEVIYKYKLN